MSAKEAHGKKETSSKGHDPAALEKSLGYIFTDKLLFKQSLTHKSFTYDNLASDVVNGVSRHNERLEFLGDAVIDLVVSTYIFNRYLDKDEGELSRIRSMAVEESALAPLAKKLGLGSHIIFGKGEQKSKGSEKSSILANCYEAVIGAIFLDGGFEIATKVVLNHFRETLDAAEESKFGYKDFKSILQEYSQKTLKEIPSYRIVKEIGPAHRKTFRIEVSAGDDIWGVGEGKNKKEAEQNAASDALAKMDNFLNGE